MAVMKGFWGTGPDHLSRVRVVMVDQDHDNRENGIKSLIDLGCAGDMVTGCPDIHSAEKILRTEMVDLLMIDHHPDPDNPIFPISQVIHRIRHGHLGINPFVIIIVTLSSQHIRDIGKLLFIGADDVVIKPLSGKVLAERVEYNAVHRRPFVVTSNYIGPDRRADDDRPSDIPQFEVPNTLLHQMVGVDQLSDANNRAKIRAAVDAITNARLEQHAQSLAVLSHLVIDTCLSRLDGAERMTPVRRWLRVMLSLLRDVQRIGHDTKNEALFALAYSMRLKIQNILRRKPEVGVTVFGEPGGVLTTEADIAFLRDLVEAVTVTMGLMSVPNQDIPTLARSYRRHNTHPAPPSMPIRMDKQEF